MAQYIGRGSEWQRWDLHVHTKGTVKNDQFTSADFHAFCVSMFKKAIAEKIAVIGITDYFNIDNYMSVRDFVDRELDKSKEFCSAEKKAIKKILILPNVELRMLPTTGKERLVNIHCLFNPEYVPNLESVFFPRIQNSGERHHMTKLGITELGNGIYKESIKQFIARRDDLEDLLNGTPEFRKNVIIAVSNSNKDGASGLQKHYSLFENEPGNLDNIRKAIYKMSDAIFSSNPDDRDFFLGEKKGNDEQTVIAKCGSLKPCIHGCDAHTEAKLFAPDEQRFCWIKADPTFEGLKQILYEPADRVKIQPQNPEEKSGYHVIDCLTINIPRVCQQDILLNPNLNTIIGGRSTGKSTLLQMIAHAVNPSLDSIELHVKDMNGVKVVWRDKEENKDRDIEFFPQGYMYNIAQDPNEKDKLIQKIVVEKDTNGTISTYRKFIDGNKTILQTSIDNLFKLQQHINGLANELKEKGDRSGVEKEIMSIKNNMNNIHQKDNFSGSELGEHENVAKEISRIKQIIQKLENDNNEIKILINENLFDASYVYKFNGLSDLYSNEVQQLFEDIKKQAINTWQENLFGISKNIDAQIEEHKKEIKTKENLDIFKKGNSYIEQNKQYKQLKERLVIEDKKLRDIKTIEEQISKVKQQKEELRSKIIECHIAYSDKIGGLVDSFTLLHDDIKISIKKAYREAKCRSLLEDFVNLRTRERQNYVNSWISNYENNTKQIIADFLEMALQEELELKSYKDMMDLAKGLLTENWFDISYELTYQNDTFDKMSNGKKAFVILKLLLEFSSKQCPILIDQPEDSLDNRAIYNELVAYLKQKKKERQIILVTHNANIVVNSDAEEVIVANQHGENSKNDGDLKFQYVSGSLENTKGKDQSNIVLYSQGIREHVCDILEGGNDAFKKRERKYGIDN